MLDAAVRSELGLMPPSVLPARVAAAYGEADIAGAMERVTGRAPRPPRASLGGLLLDCAAEGDELALERVGWVARENAGLPARGGARVRPGRADADHARRRRHAPRLVAARRRAGRRRCPGCELRRARREPAHGALMAALDEGGAGVVALDDSALPGDLFATRRAAAGR